MGAAIAAAAMRLREKEVIADFQAAGATSPDRAQSFAAIGVNGSSLAVRRLRNRAVVREASPGVYYFDEEVWSALERLRRRLAFTFVAIMAILAIGLALGFFKF
jgi:hypothetical protein